MEEDGIHGKEEFSVSLILDLSFLNRVIIVIHGSIISLLHEEKSQDTLVELSNEMLDGDEILQTLRHLQTLNMQVTSVHEVVDPLVLAVLLIVVSFTLS